MAEKHSGFEATGTIDSKRINVLESIIQKEVEIASASTITLGEGNLFFITGTTNITNIAVADTISGRVIYLAFDDVLTVDNVHMYISGGSFTTSHADILCLVCFGTAWLEVSRSVNI